MKILFLLSLCFGLPATATALRSGDAQQATSADEATTLTRKVVQLYNRGELDAALPLAERALDLRQRSLQANDPLVAEALSNLGSIYQSKKIYDKAEDFYKRSLTIFEATVKPNPGIHSVLDSLSLLRYGRGDFSKSEFYALQALDSKEKMLGKEHIEVAKTLTILVKTFEARGDEKKAEPLYERVVSILEKTDTTVPETLARALASYACSVTINREETQKRIDDLFVKIRPGVPAKGTVRGGVLNGKAACLTKPTYPLLARENRAKGTVVVQVTIDEAGKVLSAKAVSGAAELADVSEKAALKSRFMPTYLSGYPVSVTGVITYNFVPQPQR